MSPASGRHVGLSAVLAGVLVACLLPATALAAAPIAVDDHLSVPVGAPATVLDVSANDTDIDGGTLTITDKTDGAHGAVVLTGGTGLTYQPEAAFHGTDAFEYTITDGVDTDIGTVTVDVNTPPVAVDDPSNACGSSGMFGGAYPVPEDFIGTMAPTDQTILIGDCGLLGNDTDPDGDVLTYEIVDQPAHGQAFQYPGDLVGYRADANYSTAAGFEPGGQWISDTFTYRAFDGYAYSPPATMKIWVAPINDAPTFTPGGTVTVVENSGQYSAVWATNVSPGPFESSQTVHFLPGGPVVVEGHGPGPLFETQPALDGDGNLTFSIRPNTYGVAHVKFYAKDDGGLESYGTWAPVPVPDDTSDDVTFDIVVEQRAVTAVDDIEELPEDPETYPSQGTPYPNPWPIHVLANDTFPPGSRITSVSQGTLGHVTIAPDGQSVLYGPLVNSNGSDSFTYTLADGAGSTDTATVSVSISPINDVPNAVADSVSVAEEAAATAVPVLANDSDVDGDTLTILNRTDGSKGVVVITGGGTGLTYQPNADETGADSFTYTVTDGFPIGGGLVATDTATVNVTIGAVNDVPVAVADNLMVIEDAATTTVPVLANDTDVDGHTLTITVKTEGAKGLVQITGGGTGLTYRPNANANGSDSFTYTVSDGHGGTATATVNVTISAVNDVPNAVDDGGLTVPESAGATALAVGANDTDADGEALSIMGATHPAHGTVVITGGGTGLTYDPVQLYFGTDVFTYTISDGHGGTDAATVLLTVLRDTTKPTVTAPSERFFAQKVGSSTSRMHLSWSAADAGGTGIASYRLQVSVNGGRFSTITLPSITSTSIDRTLTDGRSYRYRVRATDRQANVSAYVYGPTFQPGRIQNTSLSVKYAGRWVTRSTSAALGRSDRHASSLGARASITRTVRDFAWVATKTPTSGWAQVWVDGVLAATINLRSTSTPYRRLVFQRHFSTLASHTLEIRPIGGGRIDLDAFLMTR